MADVPAPPRPPDKPVDEMSVEELAAAVRYHNWRYFSLAAPEISDYAFDRLTRRLGALAPDHPALAELTPEGAGAEKVFHDSPMLSLDKVYDEAELGKWLDGEGRRGYEGGFIETPKIDGVAASLKYGADGRLLLAATRGDGVKGEAFTANARHVDAIPKQLSGPALEAPVEVRGEVYLRLSVFRELPGDFSSPRNTTAGALKLKEAERTGDYRLSFYAYDVLGPGFATEMDKVAWAEARGLTPVPTVLRAAGEIQAGYEGWLARRDELDLEIDGVVYKMNDLAAQQRLGATSHHPRYAVAYKFPGDSGTSTVQAVEWSVSRTGKITPVAIIDPIELSGAEVRRCSLHNLTVMRELGIAIGATVVAMRRGGVIPHIERVVEPGVEAALPPGQCPSCGRPTEVTSNAQVKGGETTRVVEFLRCSAPLRCPAAIKGTLSYFTRAVGIDGFGPKIVEQLVDRGLVETPADFFRLGPEDLVPLERMGETLARKLVANIQGARRLPLATFLNALGVEGMGEAVARLLAEQFRSLDRVMALTVEDLVPLEGFQETLATLLVEGLEEQRALVEALREHVAVEDYHAVEASPAAGGDHPLAGRSVVFTGGLESMDRKSAQKLVRDHGGSTPSDVSKGLDLLVVGDKGSPLLGDAPLSTKHKKAEKLNAEGAAIRILTEAQFLELVGGA